MLRIEHLTKTYGGKKAVDDLSLHIRAGEIYGFIGHNGAGKTTTINLPDNPDLYEFLSGVQYLNFIADVYGVPKEEREQRIKEYADLFGLTEDLAQPISAYSHGMKQKLAIISALIHSPKLLIMDEPFVGLDPKAAHELKQIMRRLCDSGSAIFFSTHVLEVAEKLCDKVAIIKGGRLAVSGTMEEVKGQDSLEDVFLELEDDNA